MLLEKGEENISPKKKWHSIFAESGLPATTFNFINSIVGSGVIGRYIYHRLLV